MWEILPWTEYRGPSEDNVYRRESKKFTLIRPLEHEEEHACSQL